MPRNPSVSIVVPVYAAAASLERCLDSLAGQTCGDMEIITVNDASPDRCQDILESFAKRDGRFRIIVNSERGNAYDARRKGFAMARGDLFATCDADDWMPPDALHRLRSAALEHDADIVHGRTSSLANGRTNGIFHLSEPFPAGSGLDFIRSFCDFRRGWSVWGKLFRRRLWERALPFLPENRNWFSGDDLLFSYLFALNAKRYVPVSGVVYHYNPPQSDYFRKPEKMEEQARSQLEILRHILDTGSALSPAADVSEAVEALCAYIVRTIRRNSGSAQLVEKVLSELPPGPFPESPARLREMLAGGEPGPARSLLRLMSRGGGGETYIAFRRLLMSLKTRGWQRTIGKFFS